MTEYVFLQNYDKQLNDRTMKKLLVTALLTATVAGGNSTIKISHTAILSTPYLFTSVKLTDSGGNG